MKKLIICCLLIVLLSTMSSYAFLPVSAAEPEGDIGDINIGTSIAKFDTDWNIKGYGTDARGFSFQISISDPIKYYELYSDGSVKSVKDLGLDTGSKFEIGEGNLYLYGPYIHITISSEYSPQHDFLKWTEYPTDPNLTETMFSLLLKQKTKGAVLAALDSIAGNIKDEESAKLMMPIMVKFLATPLWAVVTPKETPSGWLIAAIGGGVAVVAAVPATIYFVTKRKRSASAS
ncbi:MAG: hypothetical protein IJY16_01890 [Clostridia bacterium]|nr:hypothetical protein [Clostridia bacterium]